MAGDKYTVPGIVLVEAAPLLERVGDWRAFLAGGQADDALEAIRRHARTGRPLGGAAFLEALETRLGRQLRPGKPGPKPRGGEGGRR